MHSICFSPNDMRLVRAQRSTMSLDFSTDSAIQIFKCHPKLQLESEQTFSTSFTCCDWSFSDHIAAGGEEGALLITKSASLQSAEIKKVAQAEITALKLSDESEGVCCVGTAAGDVIFVSVEGEVQFTAQTAKGTPHAAKVVKATWNPRVPRVCCTLDQDGTAIVWDLKKKGAVMQFTVSGGLDVVFSQDVATVLYVLNKQNEVEVWDLRAKGQHQNVVKIAGNPVALQMVEGAAGILGVKCADNFVLSLELEGLTVVGKARCGQVQSFVYPNTWAIQQDTDIQLICAFNIVRGKPIIFNTKLLTGTLGENEDEVITLVKRPICFSSKNVLRNVQGGNVVGQKISDCAELIQQVEKALQDDGQTQATELQKFFKAAETPRDQLLQQALGEFQAKVELKQSEKKSEGANVIKVDKNVDNFFDDVEEVQEAKPVDKVIQPAAVKPQQFYSQTIVNLVLENDPVSAMNQAANDGDFALAYAIASQLKVPHQAVEALTQQFKRLNPKHQELFNLIDQVAVLTPGIDSADWRQSLKYAKTHNLNVADQIRSLLKEKKVPYDHVVELLIYLGDTAEALSEATKAAGKLDFEHKLAAAIRLNKIGMGQLTAEMETIISVVTAQGRADLAQQLKHKLGGRQAPQRQPVQPGLPHAPTKLPPVLSPPLNFPQPAQHPVAQNITSPPAPLQQQLAQPPSFFSMGSGPVSNVKQAEPPKEAQPLYAVDIFANTRPAAPVHPAAQPQLFQPAQPAFQPTQPAFQPAQPVFQPTQPVFQPQQQQAEVFMPPPPVNNLVVPEPAHGKPAHAFASRGPEITAPAPPGGHQQQLIKVQQTTAPQKKEKPQPVQHLDHSLKNLDLVNSVQLKTKAAQQFAALCQTYARVDTFSFNKASSKLAELLAHLSDYAEVPGLMSEAAVQQVEQITVMMGSKQTVGQAGQALQEFGKRSDELMTWAGTLKVMAGSMAK